MEIDETYLQHRLFRHRCPAPEQIGDYALRFLNADRARLLRGHLGRCPHCRRELVGFQRVLAIEPERKPGWLSVWRARREPVSADAPVYALRGEEEGPRLYSAENGTQVAIDIQPQPDGYFTLIGVIIGATGAAIDLWQAGTHQSAIAADELGNFQFDALTPGSYELIVADEAFLLHIDPLLIQ